MLIQKPLVQTIESDRSGNLPLTKFLSKTVGSFRTIFETAGAVTINEKNIRITVLVEWVTYAPGNKKTKTESINHTTYHT